MKETTRFDAGFQAEGRVCVQYTDTTGRVREEIRGKNHVYVDQMMTTNWINDIMVNVPLVLTNSRRPVDTTFPYVPGEIIGYGVPGSSGTDAYFGSFRGNESYRALRTRTSCSSKFIYDFSPTQALGTLGHIGLSFQPNQKVYSATMIKPGQKFSSKGGIDGSSNTMLRGYVNIGYFRYRTDSSANGNYVVKRGLFEETEKAFNISSLLTIPDGFSATSYDIPGYRAETGNFCLICRYYKKLDDGSYIYRYTCYELNEALDTVLSSVTFDTENLTSMNAFGRYGNKLYLFPYYIHSGSNVNTIFVFDIDTGELSRMNAPLCMGLFLGGDGVYSFYDKYIGCSSKGYGAAGYGFIFDLENGEIFAQMVGKGGSYQARRFCLYRNPASTCGAFLQSEEYNISAYSHPYGGAITDYRMPDDAPERPEGYGMTVIYELNVLW